MYEYPYMYMYYSVMMYSYVIGSKVCYRLPA